MKKNWTLGILLFFILACNKSDFCIIPNTSKVSCSFSYYNSSNKLVDTSLDRLTIYTTDTSHIYIEDQDEINTFFYYPNPSFSTQQVVLKSQAISTRYDTLTVTYEPKLSYISNGCGYEYNFELKSVQHTSHFIEKVNILNASVNSNSSNEHLEIIIQ